MTLVESRRPATRLSTKSRLIKNESTLPTVDCWGNESRKQPYFFSKLENWSFLNMHGHFKILTGEDWNEIMVIK